MSTETDHVVRLKLRRFPFVFLGLTCLFFFGMIALLAIGDAPGAAIVVGLIMGPPGLFLLILGITLSRLSIRCDGSFEPARISFRLARAGSAPLFPWWLHSRTVSVADVSRIDVVLRKNPASSGGLERLYHLRTEQGDFYFNSVTFSNWSAFDEFVTAHGIALRVGSPDQIMEAIPGSTTQPSTLELGMRGCGWTLLAALTVIIVLGGIVAVFGDPSARSGGWKAVLIAALGLGAVPAMIRYRRVK